MEPHPLHGQVAIVTGGGRGIGRAMAEALAAAGAGVAVAARSTAQVEETAARIEAAGGRAAAYTVDVTDAPAMRRMVEAVEQTLGPVTLLVNNAGVFGPIGPTWELDLEEWWRVQEINVRGALVGCHAVLPVMVARKHGRIVNIASGAGLAPIAYGAAYAVSKATLIRFSENLAIETQPHGIRVFALDPGSVRTAMAEYLVTDEAVRWVPWTRDLFEHRAVPIDLSARLVVAIASGAGDRLSGRYVTVQNDLNLMAQRADEIEQADLYTLRMRWLDAA